MASRLPLIITCALLSGAAGAAGAAELGEAQVRSYIGQRLVADIELTMLDAPATPVQARLAHPNVYRGANIGMPHVLSTLAMTVTQREGRQFLQVTSLAPVESNRLHLYLELTDGGQRDVRLVTLSMAPDPNPPPPPAPVRMPAPVVADTAAPAPVVAKPPPKPRPPPPPKPVVAKIAPRPEPESRPEPKQEAQPAPAAEPKPAPRALPLPLAAPAAPAACAPAPDVDRSTVCAALDYKNAQLREQIGQLEDKVKVLQVALGASPAAVSKPRPLDPNKPHPARRRPAPEPEAPTPWDWIAGGLGAVLALAVAAILMVRRRKRAGRIQPMPGMPLMTRLRQRFARKKASQEPVEPKLDETEQEMSTQV
ncbi:hypothetical protein ACFOHT_08960 [Massilia oculi]|uniref:FimV N-terminal domain-containing protein n=1 Tax=Massilia oculi TaxID=945844 RepID=A0A2S2DFE6_9BURK|nr:hypothetical protein [Massilia oculi]AWL04080.1 hypothetical protein DIR46_06290 [Massilia oculi]